MLRVSHSLMHWETRKDMDNAAERELGKCSTNTDKDSTVKKFEVMKTVHTVKNTSCHHSRTFPKRKFITFFNLKLLLHFH
jgi:hypothetical protein